MIQYLYTVFDKPADAYLPMFPASNEKQAIRIFQSALADHNTKFAQFPQDYTMYFVGDFDPNTGVLRGEDPVRVMSALEALQSLQRENPTIDMFKQKFDGQVEEVA